MLDSGTRADAQEEARCRLHAKRQPFGGSRPRSGLATPASEVGCSCARRRPASAAMIPGYQIEQVEQLLQEGRMSQRAIARFVGISRGTVNAVALGRRPDYEAQAREAEAQKFRPARPTERCGHCGALLKIVPCVACRARRHARRRRQRGPVHVSRVIAELLVGSRVLDLDLKSEDRARYEQIRKDAR